MKKYNTLKNSNNNINIQNGINIIKNNKNALCNYKINESNRLKENDNNKDKEINYIEEHKNENLNKDILLNNKNKEELLELNNKNLEDDSKFINFSIINDYSDIFNISKLDNDINNNIYLNERKKDICEYEYEFEDYINNLNMNKMNIDKQLHERPLSSYRSILNSATKYKINKKNNNIINIKNNAIQKKNINLDKIFLNDINNLGQIDKYRVVNRNEKKECFNDLKIDIKKKPIKIFETSNNRNINKIKYFDKHISDQKLNNKILNKKSFSSNENISKKESKNNIIYYKDKNIINIQTNKIKKKNKFFISNNNSTRNTSHYEKTINNKIENNNNKKDLMNNKNILMKTNENFKKKNIKINQKQKEKLIIKKIENSKIKNVNNNKTSISSKNKIKKQKKYLTQNNSRKIYKILNEDKERDIKEIIQKQKITHLIIHRNKNYNNCQNLFTKTEIKRKYSLSQTFILKQPQGDLDNCINLFTNNKINKIKTNLEPKILKTTKSHSNLFSQYNKLICKNITNSKSSKKLPTTKNLKNSPSIINFRKKELTTPLNISKCNRIKNNKLLESKIGVVSPKQFSIFEKNNKKEKKLKNSVSYKTLNLNKKHYLLKRNIFEITDISGLLKENGLNNIINEDNIKTKKIICFINGQNLEIFNDNKNDNNLAKKVVQIKAIENICVINKSKNILIINYLDKELMKTKQLGLLIENENIANEYIQNLKKVSNNFAINYGIQNLT